MKYLKQFGIIIGISFLGEICKSVLPLPIPASIYGILILFFCLFFHILSVDSVKEVSRFLIEIMPVMFIPAAVGLIESWETMRSSLTAYLMITVISTFIVMAVSGIVTQSVMKYKEKKKQICDKEGEKIEN